MNSSHISLTRPRWLDGIAYISILSIIIQYYVLLHEALVTSKNILTSVEKYLLIVTF